MVSVRNLIVLIGVIIYIPLWAGETQLKMDDFSEDEIHISGFVLDKAKTIHVESLGAGERTVRSKTDNYHRDKYGMIAYGWILNSATREVVWAMTNENSKRQGRGFNRLYEGEISLPEGEYEVYFSTLKLYSIFNKGIVSFGDFLDYIFDGDDWWDKGLEEWFIKIDNVDKILSNDDVRDLQKKFERNAVVSINMVEDSEFREFEFEVSDDVDVTVYSIGEGMDGKMYDYSWISGYTSTDKIWEMREWHTDYAGGALKNRMINKTIHLPKGQYILNYSTDGSHSAEEWNSNPPYDPTFWGVTLIAKNEDKQKFHKIKSQKTDAFISFQRVGDDELLDQAFRVKEKTAIIVEAMGEGRPGKMVDYGWIEDADNDIVWEMTYYKTKHAGGSEKNRMVREQIELDKGYYTVYYRSDGSHSYDRWNSDRPFRANMWGISLYPSEPNKVELADSRDVDRDSDWDIRLIRIRDDVHRFQSFSIKKLSRITIYAIGEGDDDEMYDYAWIENKSTGEIVWKMLYRNTHWAGGADKNRKVKTEIYLPEGDYILHYKSDGSHSYRDWNDDPPRDENNYGVSIQIEKTD